MKVELLKWLSLNPYSTGSWVAGLEDMENDKIAWVLS